MSSTLRFGTIIGVLLATILLSLTTNSFAGQDSKKIILETYANLNYSPGINSIQLLVGGQKITMGAGWETKEVEAGIYHLRRSKWKNAFWEVNLGKKTLNAVKEGVFGKRAERRNSVALEAVFGSGRTGSGPGSQFFIRINNSRIIYEPVKKKFDIQIAGMSITTSGEWETATAAPDIYHVQHSSWSRFYWEIDAKERKANYISRGMFGSTGWAGSRIVSMKFVGANKAAHSVVESSGARSGSRSNLEDFGFNSSTPTRITDWTRSEKRLFESMLNGNYDVLVVPFQVKGYAFDRANRSLMTRYLAHAIESRTDLKLPDPTLVAKALGDRVRMLSDDDVYRIARRLNVKVLVRGYVGHNLDEKITLTLLVQSKGEDGAVGPMSRVTRLDWQDIPFSDERPPAEVFRGFSNEVAAKLPLQLTKNPKPAYFNRSKLEVPQGIGPILGGKPSALRDAHNLQLLGMLYPVDISKDYVGDYYEREPLFERSLVALEGVSPKSPDHKLLKARAWFYLRSRAAALNALGMPKSPKEKAFMGYLNGNLYEMEKWTTKIKSPLDRLIAMIELNDIRLDYRWVMSDMEFAKEIVLSNKGLEVLLARRLSGKDKLGIIPSASIKHLLDEAFPVKGFDIKTILRGKGFTQGVVTDDYEIDLSIYRHRRKILESNIDSFAGESGASRPVALDHLELIYHVGESNLWRKARFLGYVQGSFRGAVALLEIYEETYRGHLKHMYLTALAKFKLRRTKSRYRVEADDLWEKVCYHAQGQLNMTGCRDERYYMHDYPRYWPELSPFNNGFKRTYLSKGVERGHLGRKAEHLRALEHDLLYSHNKFAPLTVYYEELMNYGMRKEAKELLRLNGSRFDGNPYKDYFLADEAAKANDYSTAAAIYEQGIAKTPGEWQYYFGLGFLYLKTGEYTKALSAFKRYPLFLKKGDGSVEYSNRAYLVANTFLSSGLIKEAEPFLKMTANNNAGIFVEERSRAFLALTESDLPTARMHFLRAYKNNSDLFAFSANISMLHAAGKHEEARAIYSAVNHTNQVPFEAIIGSRMEGVGEEEQARRIHEDKFEKLTPFALYNYTAMSMMDRAPEPAALTRVKSLVKAPDTSVSVVKTFGEGYYLIKSGRDGEAFRVFKKFKDKYINKGFWRNYNQHKLIIPYYAYTAAKTGHAPEALEFLEDVREKLGKDYEYHLAMAFINGLENRHEEALKNLSFAKNRMGTLVTLPMPQWYKLVEAYEWLYAESGKDEYIRHAVELAKTYQKIMPVWAWAYAVEAKYSKPGQERTRALALALYLDKRSERISGIPESEKQKALKWLDRYNPFIERERVKGGV